jgi:hypothetical protein
MPHPESRGDREGENEVDIPKATPSWWWTMSAATVPNTATIITAAQ